MSKLEDHIVEIDGVKYVPYSAARKVLDEGYGNYVKQLDKFQKTTQDIIKRYDEGIKKVLGND